MINKKKSINSTRNNNNNKIKQTRDKNYKSKASPTPHTKLRESRKQ